MQPVQKIHMQYTHSETLPLMCGIYTDIHIMAVFKGFNVLFRQMLLSMFQFLMMLIISQLCLFYDAFPYFITC